MSGVIRLPASRHYDTCTTTGCRQCAAADAVVDGVLVRCLWCGEWTEHDETAGRQVVETRLGVGTTVKGRLCPACSADSHDIDEEAR